MSLLDTLTTPIKAEIYEKAIKAYRIKLHPTKEQEQKLWQASNVARWAYNWTLAREQEQYNLDGKFVCDGELRKELTQLKKTEEFVWLNDVAAEVSRQGIKDACLAYERFFKHQSDHPRFKGKKRTVPSFYHKCNKLKYANGRVILEKIGWVKTAIPLPEGKYSNPRVKYDGLNWYLTVGIEIKTITLDIPLSEPIGIDLGISELAVISNGNVVGNINKTEEVKRLNKKLKRLQRQASRQYLIIQRKGGRKSKNLLKLEREVRLIHKRLKNIRTNHIHQATSKLVKANPEYIVIEDLNVSGMIKNKHLTKAIREQKLHSFRRQIEYKCQWYGVRLIIADRFFPSSKTCSQCGQIKKDLKLSDRVYRCDCGLHINRDLNAAINLREYGRIKLAS